MDYTLMHKNIPVAGIVIDESYGSVLGILDIMNPDHIPVGMSRTRDTLVNELNHWWTKRSIPADRVGVRDILEALGIPVTTALLTKALGLSLSDHYWVRPSGSSVQWEQVNFFQNDFSKDIGDIAFGEYDKNEDVDCMSPDNTSDGVQRKKWVVRDGERYLIKSDRNYPYQQPYNEAIAAVLMHRLGIDCVDYSVVFDSKGDPCSMCPNFLNTETELVSAAHLLRKDPCPKGEDLYRHYIQLCKNYGVEDIENGMEKMLIADYLLVNNDRHLNNFGLIRNAESLKYTGMAPIFDSGSSLGWNKAPDKLFSAAMDECKPFAKSHDQQLKYVRDFSSINFQALEGLGNDMRRIMSYGEKIAPERIDAAVALMQNRVDGLRRIAERSIRSKTGDIFFTLSKVEIDIPPDIYREQEEQSRDLREYR